MAKTLPPQMSARPTEAPEYVIVRMRCHARRLFWPTVFLLALCAAAGYFYGSFSESWQNLTVLAVACGGVILLWFFPFLSWLTRRYTITSRRVIVRHGVVVRVRADLLHSHGYGVTVSVTVSRNWLQALFRSGSIRIRSGADTALILRDVPNVMLVQRMLQDLIERSHYSA